MQHWKEEGKGRRNKRAHVFSFITFIFNLSAHATRACECTAGVGGARVPQHTGGDQRITVELVLSFHLPKI